MIQTKCTMPSPVNGSSIMFRADLRGTRRNKRGREDAIRFRVVLSVQEELVHGLASEAGLAARFAFDDQSLFAGWFPDANRNVRPSLGLGLSLGGFDLYERDFLKAGEELFLRPDFQRLFPSGMAIRFTQEAIFSMC